jgi:hypothetical protein
MGERRYWIRFVGAPADDPREAASGADAGDAGGRTRPAAAGDARERRPRATPEDAPGLRLRPASAPAGGTVAVCPHCWQVNVGGERLCGRCGADMTLLLQESGGLRRTPAVQSPVPVRVSGRLGPVTRALLLVLTVMLALAWLVVPLLGAAYRRAYVTGGISGSRLPNGLHHSPQSHRVRRAGVPDGAPPVMHLLKL